MKNSTKQATTRAVSCVMYESHLFGPLCKPMLTRFLFATALTCFLALVNLGAAQAGDYSSVWKTMKPLYAVSFEVGRKHVLSYFLSRNGLCNLTMMVTDRPVEPPEGDEILPLVTARFKAEITGGQSARFDTTEGKTLEYACETGAHAMKVREVNQVATTSPLAR